MAILAVFTLTSFPCMCLQRWRERSPSPAAHPWASHYCTYCSSQQHLRGHGNAPACDRAQRTHELALIFSQIVTETEVQIRRPARTIIPTASNRNARLAYCSMKFWSLAKGSQSFPFQFFIIRLQPDYTCVTTKGKLGAHKDRYENEAPKCPTFLY